MPDKLDELAGARYTDGHTYTLDGFSAEFPDWHFNVRGSNTEPLLRLNLEATTQALMEAEARRGAGVHPVVRLRLKQAHGSCSVGLEPEPLACYDRQRAGLA